MNKPNSEKAIIDPATGDILFETAELVLYKGMLLTELSSRFSGIEFRDFDKYDPVTGLKTSDPNWKPNKKGFAYFETPLDIEGMLFNLTIDIDDYAINFIALKAVTELCNNTLGSDWDGEKKVRQIHYEWLSRLFNVSAQISNRTWEFKWGEVVDYYDEIQWGAAIWIIQKVRKK